MSNTTKVSKFYTQATITFTESSRRKGGYFNYTDTEIKNAIVEVIGNKAFIYDKPGAKQIYYSCTTKMTTGKYFNMQGKEVKKATFDKHLKSYLAIIESNKATAKAAQDEATRLGEMSLENAKQKIRQILTPEKMLSYEENAQKGNSHERRTRWSNRAERAGVKGYGNLLRDAWEIIRSGLVF